MSDVRGSEAQHAPAEAAPRRRQPTGMDFRVAATLDEAVAAWKMVYTAYRQGGLIDPNPYGLHTAPHAVSEQAAIILGCIGPVTVSTLTAFLDAADRGLPLDRVYGPELQSIRRGGRKLLEIGLFADRRNELSRSLAALFELMRFAFHYGRLAGVTDFVIGVHPRHARFYARSFHFEIAASPRVYPAVNNRPVVLLRGDMQGKLEQARPGHPALEYFVNHPVAAEVFERRYRFPADEVERSVLSHFLRDREDRGRLSLTA